MTDDLDRRRRDWQEASYFSSAIKDEARALLREGSSIQAVADDLHVPTNVVAHWNIKVERAQGKRAKRQAKRPDWTQHDAATITAARHRATAGATAADLASEFHLPEKVAAYIVRRARLHANRRAKAAQAAQAGASATPA